MPNCRPEPDMAAEGVRFRRYCLRGRVADFDHRALLAAIANHEWQIEPSVCGPCYVINASRDTAFELYDDRGLDIVAVEPDALRPVYRRYYAWILDWNREQIDAAFARPDHR